MSQAYINKKSKDYALIQVIPHLILLYMNYGTKQLSKWIVNSGTQVSSYYNGNLTVKQKEYAKNHLYKFESLNHSINNIWFNI